MKNGKKIAAASVTLVSILVLGAGPAVVLADEQPASTVIEAPEIKLPGDLSKANSDALIDDDAVVEGGALPKYEIEERRINGRLERVTVKRNNGVDEVYETREANSMISHEEEELGDVPNVRRWTIGSW